MGKENSRVPTSRVCLHRDLEPALRNTLLNVTDQFLKLALFLSELGCDVKITAHLGDRELMNLVRGPGEEGPVSIGPNPRWYPNIRKD